MSEEKNNLTANSPADEDELLPTEAELAGEKLPMATVVETVNGPAEAPASPNNEEKQPTEEPPLRKKAASKKSAPEAEQPLKRKSDGNKAADDNISELEQAMKDQAREDEKPQSTSFSLRKILGGDWLTAELLRRQIGVILLVTGFIIVYISNRYSCQKDMLEIDRLNAELIDAKYRALSSTSELTERCRESNVLEMLKENKDSVLKIASQPPYIITVPDNYVRINNK
ncbi:MAG: hypothetical protein II612_02685 [Prevotella sp.]|nr:hypothetical protein [Prevotella sp.]